MKNKQPKMTRKERERRMIEEMESALLEQKFPETKKEKAPEKKVETPRVAKQAERTNVAPKKGAQKLHCPRCKSVMEEGKCSACGHYIYVPMDKEKRNKIRLIVGGVCMVGFVILFVLLQMKK